jgi:hypothetical protein
LIGKGGDSTPKENTACTHTEMWVNIGIFQEATRIHWGCVGLDGVKWTATGK